MSGVQFNSDWHYNGCRVLRLESDLLRLDVLPELGGKILHWVHKPEGRDWLWQHPRIKPAILPQRSNYDDHWSGGWDELFPNGGACTCDGESYPDHGEYWTLPCDWRPEVCDDAATLYTRAEGRASPTRMERWITLQAGSPGVRIRHRITHLGAHGFHFLWAFHPGLAVRPGCRLLIPAGRGEIASPGIGRLGAAGREFNWPHVPARDGDVTVDFSLVPEPTAERGYEMVYLTELHAGWFAIHDPATRSGFGLSFDPGLFNAVWVFQTHGGWRGLNVVNIEPATGFPYDLSDAVRQGRCSFLEGGQVLETESFGVVFAGRDTVAGIERDGTVL